MKTIRAYFLLKLDKILDFTCMYKESPKWAKFKHRRGCESI